MIMMCHSVNNNTRMGLAKSLCSNSNHLISLTTRTASNFRHLLSCGTIQVYVPQKCMAPQNIHKY